MNFVKLPNEDYINLDTVAHVARLRNKETWITEGVRVLWAGTENEAGDGLCTDFKKEEAADIIAFLEKKSEK